MDEEEDISAEGAGLSGEDEEEEDFDARKHASMLRDLSAMDGEAPKYKSTAERHELSEMSEYHTPASRDSVHLHQLVSALEEKPSNKEVKKQIQKVKGVEKALPMPLAKPQQERLHRSLAYETISKDMDKWQSIVMKNRNADQQAFPLPKKGVKVLTTVTSLKNMKPKTGLEHEVASILRTNDTKIDPNYHLTKAEKQAIEAMSVTEARERRAELQKYRVLLSYQEAKARRQNKIKSKSYHRLLRKEALKKEQKTLEEMERTDPEAYADKLHKLDQDRMKERHTLKHRGGSKFAKKQVIYKKYDDKARADIQEMLQKSRELTKKVALEDESSGGEASDVEPLTDVDQKPLDSKNPWMTAGIKISKTPKSSGSGKLQPISNTVLPDSDEDSDTEKTMEISNLEQTAEELVEFSDRKQIGPSQSGEGINEETVKTLREMKVDTEKDDTKKKKKNRRPNYKKAKQETSILKEGPSQSGEGTDEETVKTICEMKVDTEKDDTKKNKKNRRPKNKKAKQETSMKEDSEEARVDIKIDELFDALEDKEKNARGNRKTRKRKVKGGESSGKEKKRRKQKEVNRNSEDVPEEEAKEEEEKRQKREALTDEITIKHSGGSGIKMSSKRKRTLEDYDKHDSDSDPDDDLDASKSSEVIEHQQADSGRNNEEISVTGNKKKCDSAVSVDPNKFITLGGSSKKIIIAEEEESEEENSQSLTIAQAFAADDVADEFRQEKRSAVQRDKPKDMDLTLPGWGDWGGEGVQTSKRKQKRFTLKAAPAAPRKDRDMDNVIISEVKDKTIAKHQVNTLPFPFNNPHQFESSIRQPIGKTWNPETSYRKLIEPKKLTKLGTIIEPMSQTVLTNKAAAERKHDREINRKYTMIDQQQRRDKKYKKK